MSTDSFDELKKYLSTMIILIYAAENNFTLIQDPQTENFPKFLT